LRYAIDKAREVSMPKDNIERAIKRGTGEMEGVHFEEITYEGYGPGGVAVLVDVLTDNRNRTNGEIRKIFERAGGKMATVGAAANQFERKGHFFVPAAGVDEDNLMSIVLDAGADDLKNSGDVFEITCDPHQFNKVQEALKAANITPAEASVTQLAKVPAEADTETGAKVLRLMELLEDHDDVQNAYSTLRETEAMHAQAHQ
jgi:YebC/PmpR family DNA-binding regulatory protein